MKINNVINSIFTVVCMGIIFIFCIINIKIFCNTLKEKINQVGGEVSYAEAIQQTNEQFRLSIKYKQEFVDLYGRFQRIIGKRIIGNYEYALDDAGVLHAINDLTDDKSEKFAEEVVKLNEYLMERNIPMIYIQSPSREYFQKGTCYDEFNKDEEREDNIIRILRDNNVEVFDLRENLAQQEYDLPFRKEKMYLATDLHMGTDAEIWMAAETAKYLSSKGFVINNIEYLIDMDLYDKRTYLMYGNYGRTNGRYYIAPDRFDIYHPKFETNYTSWIYGDDSLTRYGNFEEAVLNGLENSEYDDYTYWVVNFANFMRPYYGYTNNLQKDTKILIICDSIEYRAFSYLLQTVNTVDILDCRFFGGEDYLGIALLNEYDVVILWGSTHLLDSPYIVR